MKSESYFEIFSGGADLPPWCKFSNPFRYSHFSHSYCKIIIQQANLLTPACILKHYIFQSIVRCLVLGAFLSFKQDGGDDDVAQVPSQGRPYLQGASWSLI